MPAKIVVLDGYTLAPDPQNPSEVNWSPLAPLGELVCYDRTPDDLIIERASESPIVLTNKTPLHAAALSRLPNLRYVGVLATGVNVVDLNIARQQNITVTNVPGYSTESVAQHVFALLLALTNQVAEHDQAVREGQWQRCPDFSFTLGSISELAGKTLGIVGLGAIGRQVAQIGSAFGMTISAAHQRSMHQVRLPGIEIAWMPVDELVQSCDVLTLHCPLTDQTRHLINADRLSRMKPNAILINTGRGPLVDEPALAQALRLEQIAGAGIDVLTEEPPASGSPLIGAPRCVITPHNAWASVEARQRLMAMAAANLKAWLDGHPVNVVS